MVFDGSNIKINSGKESFRSSKTAPQSKPKSDFRKVLEKEHQEGEGKDDKKQVAKEEKEVKGNEAYEDVADNLTEAPLAPKNKVSLFDLAKTEAIEETEPLETSESEEVDIPELSQELKEESLSALFKGYGSKERLKAIQEEVDRASLRQEWVTDAKLPAYGGEISMQARELKGNLNAATDSAKRQPMEDLAPETSDSGPNAIYLEDKNKNSMKFTEVQGDLSGINPLAGIQTSQGMQNTPVQEARQLQSMAAHLQEIVDQIIDKLYTVNTSGRTDTLIKLKHPPLFAGSNIVISSFDTAKGEFNITFENLTQAAKNLIEMRENQEALKFALDQKGYTVHIITATTLAETISLVEGRGPEGEKEEKGKSGSHSQGNEEQEEKQKKR